MKNSLHQLVKKNRTLFWSVDENALDQLSDDAVVEAILNLGDKQSVKQLIAALGIDEVATIFFRQTSGHRTNYYPQVANYFNEYFKRYAASHYPQSSTN